MADIRVKDLDEAATPGADYFLMTDSATDGVKKIKPENTVTRESLSIDNVDNTSDADKPISTATQTALNAKADASSLATVATSGAYNDLSGKPTIGTSAALDVGMSPGNVPQLDGSGRLPAVDGSQLTGLPGGGNVIAANYGSEYAANKALFRTNIGLGAVATKDNIPWQNVGQPLCARIEGMSLGNGDTDRVITQGSGNLKHIYFGSILVDTHPSKNTGTFTAGLCILQTGTNKPDGNIRTTQAGLYEFKVGIGLDAAATAAFSLYVYLRDKGTDGSGSALIRMPNTVVPSGAHPTVEASILYPVTTSTRWFDVAVYYLASDGTNPTTIKIGNYTYQTFFEVKYLGPQT